MFKKLHRQMTFFCALITGIILMALSLTCLYISESGIKKNGYSSFLNDVYSMLTHLESQSLISYEWISKMENNGNYIIEISNNGMPLMFSELNKTEERTRLIELAALSAENDHAFYINQPVKTTRITEHIEFSMKDDHNRNYYISAAIMPKSDGYLGLLIIRPLASQHSQIIQQRILFLIIDVLAIILLTIFSYFFTKQMIRPIEKNRRQQTQFVAAASHELRTPLAVILSSLSALKKADGKEAEKFTNAIYSEGHRMSKLIDDLLLLASADNHTWTIQPELLELDTLLLDMYEKYESVTKDNGQNLKISLPDDSIARYKCDPIRIEQVISILIDNAVSYTPAGGTIGLSIHNKNNRIEIRVSDNGPGIPNEQKDQIFQRFYRVEKSHTQKKHFGLGLSIAQEIVKLHKGRITIEDTPGGGATFILSFYTNSVTY